ncbi:MAG: hypothetical protein C0456_17540 [Hyphomonas sp.]|nr:hypothetical protein [Hyphomonas sp.]
MGIQIGAAALLLLLGGRLLYKTRDPLEIIAQFRAPRIAVFAMYFVAGGSFAMFALMMVITGHMP